MGELHYFLGVKIVRWSSSPNKFDIMENAKSVSTPVDKGTKLIKSTVGSEGVDQRLYQSAVGAVSSVAKFSAEPNQQHWTAIKRILRYLKSTAYFGLLYTKDGSKDSVSYCNAD